MHFEQEEAYHIYNRGNEKQPVFFSEKNYLFFLQKVRIEWMPFSDILAYTLMPNHFHFIIVPKHSVHIHRQSILSRKERGIYFKRKQKQNV